MDDVKLSRYARQILLAPIGVEGQARWLGAHVLIVGLGGLGAPVALYLAGAGLGHLTLVDSDSVEASNLPRQILYTDEDIGTPKAIAAATALRARAPFTRLTPLVTRLSGEALAKAVASADVVVDASDNFATRFALNEAAVQARVPVVSGAAIRFEGQVSVFRHDQPEAPCYRCLYEPGPDEELCVQTGVLGPVTGAIASMQALETLKLLARVGAGLGGRLLLFDGLALEWREVRLKRDPGCPVCATRPR